LIRTYITYAGEILIVRRAVIKCPSPLRAQRDFTRLDLKREWEAYQHPSIANSPYIRKLYDLIGNPEDFDDKTGETRPCLALEWMDMTLQDLTPKLDKRAYKLIVAIIEAVMESILCFSEAKVVDTGTPLFPHYLLTPFPHSSLQPAHPSDL
jgi:chemotaxis regulatin CheY-phosphate phosphatase CheZ